MHDHLREQSGQALGGHPNEVQYTEIQSRAIHRGSSEPANLYSLIIFIIIILFRPFLH